MKGISSVNSETVYLFDATTFRYIHTAQLYHELEGFFPSKCIIISLEWFIF